MNEGNVLEKTKPLYMFFQILLFLSTLVKFK